jgi:hypothetical protein
VAHDTEKKEIMRMARTRVTFVGAIAKLLTIDFEDLYENNRNETFDPK